MARVCSERYDLYIKPSITGGVGVILVRESKRTDTCEFRGEKTEGRISEHFLEGLS